MLQTALSNLMTVLMNDTKAHIELMQLKRKKRLLFEEQHEHARLLIQAKEDLATLEVKRKFSTVQMKYLTQLYLQPHTDNVM